jgi:acyl carrier protein
VATRIFRTGDLGRYTQQSNLEIVGRKDRQVKIRGYRVNVADVEQLIEGQESVRRALVTLAQQGGSYTHLIASIVPADTTHPPKQEELRRQIEATLPRHMMPVEIRVVSEIPTLLSGKVDRQRPVASSIQTAEAVRPTSSTEAGMIEIWKEVFEISGFRPDDDFYSLNGDSLMAIQIVSRISERFGVEISLAEVLEHPTIAELSALIGGQIRHTKATV